MSSIYDAKLAFLRASGFVGTVADMEWAYYTTNILGTAPVMVLGPVTAVPPETPTGTVIVRTTS